MPKPETTADAVKQAIEALELIVGESDGQEKLAEALQDSRYSEDILVMFQELAEDQ